VYVRQIDDQVLTFQVSGKLWKRSLVMTDVETGTEWAHLLGKGMKGQWKGRVLKPLVTDMVTWGIWKQQHPDSTVLHMPRSARNYDRTFYKQPEFIVFGFEVNGESRFISMVDMQASPVLNLELGNIPLVVTYHEPGTVAHLFDRTVNGMTLTFRQDTGATMTDQQTSTVWDLLSGQAIEGELKGEALKPRVGIMSYRRAWENFHPQSKSVSAPESEIEGDQ